MKSLFLLASIFIVNTSMAAGLCMPSTCNPHNGCIYGCSEFTATGTSICNGKPESQAQNEAIEQAMKQAYAKCNSAVFRKTAWSLSSCSNQDYKITANAKFVCLK